METREEGGRALSGPERLQWVEGGRYPTASPPAPDVSDQFASRSAPRPLLTSRRAAPVNQPWAEPDTEWFGCVSTHRGIRGIGIGEATRRMRGGLASQEPSMSVEYYLARAAEARAEAQAAKLTNVRERSLRCESVWKAMAKRVAETEAMRMRNIAPNAPCHAIEKKVTG